MSRPPMMRKPLAQPFVLAELLTAEPPDPSPDLDEISTESKPCLRPSGSADGQEMAELLIFLEE